MPETKIERDLQKEVELLIADVSESRCVTSVKSRVGTAKLKDRRTAQIHVIVTTDKDEFLAKPRG